MEAWIVANGPFPEGGLPFRPPEGALVIAVDGGSRYARRLGWLPQVVIGDADSLDGETRRWLEAHGVPLQRHPRAKDETDLELALLYAVEAGAEAITIVAGWGGRPDQSIANLLLLAHPALAGRRARFLGPDYEVLMLRGGEEGALEGAAGDTVSLLPLAGAARGIRTEGLRWELDGGMLRFGPARGVSNEMTAPQARVRLEEGLLLVVHLFEKPAEER